MGEPLYVPWIGERANVDAQAARRQFLAIFVVVILGIGLIVVVIVCVFIVAFLVTRCARSNRRLRWMLRLVGASVAGHTVGRIGNQQCLQPVCQPNHSVRFLVIFRLDGLAHNLNTVDIHFVRLQITSNATHFCAKAVARTRVGDTLLFGHTSRGQCNEADCFGSECGARDKRSCA